MRSLLSVSVLVIALLGLAAAWPSRACAGPPAPPRMPSFARPPARPSQASARSPARYGWRGGSYVWHGGWRGGPYGYGPRVGYHPYANYYGLYGYYTPYAYDTPYAYPSRADYSASSYYSVPDAELRSSDSAAAELPHPTGGAPIAPPDAGFIRLRVPDEFADVTFDGQVVSSVGTTRDYVTPPLQVGQTYHYTIRAAWGRGDQQTTRQRTIDIARGQTRAVDFFVVPNGSSR